MPDLNEFDMSPTMVMVKEFHEKFDLVEYLRNKPNVPPTKLALLRIQCLTEEVAELAHAFGKGDLIGILDALTDIQYFLDGTYLLCGLETVKLAAMMEVHKSNMTKLDADGKPLKDVSGRIKKSNRYVPPNLQKVLQDYVNSMNLDDYTS